MRIIQIPVPEGPGMYQLRRLLPYLPTLDLYDGPWLAGGTVRRLYSQQKIDDADLDLFFTDIKQFDKASKQISKIADAVLKTSRAHTYRVPVGDGFQMVQCIKKSFPSSVKKMFQSFDFKVCQFATDGEIIAFAEGANVDLESNRLRLAVEGSLHSEGLYARIQKYLRYGFAPDPEFMMAVMKKFKNASHWALEAYTEPTTYSDTREDTTGLGKAWDKLEPEELVNVG